MGEKRNIIDTWLKEKGDPITERMVENNFYHIDRIEEYMMENGITTISELATILGKKQPQVSRWMSGGQNMTGETLAMIEIKLGIRLVNQGKEIVKELQPIYLNIISGNKAASNNNNYTSQNAIGYAAGIS